LLVDVKLDLSDVADGRFKCCNLHATHLIM